LAEQIECSVLLATRDRAASLERTLASLEAQAAPGIRWEVLVADNGSTDDTEAILARWAGRLPIHRAVESVAGKNRALNRILTMAQGQLLLFTDDDVVFAPGWIAGHAAAAARWPDYDIFAGVVHPLFPSTPPSWAADKRLRAILFAEYDHGAAEQPTEYLPFGPNFAVRATALGTTRFDDSVGPNGAEYPMGGETELLRRLTRQGARTVYVPGAMVQHLVRADQLTEAFVLGRALRFGRGLVRLGDVSWSPHRLFGVPRYLVRQLAEAWAARAWARLAHDHDAGLARNFAYHAVLGSVAECRESGLPRRPENDRPKSVTTARSIR
jgi:GT2 family glycosyltransferase